jgi:N-carbamoyl-L-amino-acid hydrolase
VTQDAAAGKVAARVSRDRLLALLDALARFGARVDGGVDRQALGAADIDAHVHLARHAQALGCSVRRDDAGNLFFRRAGRSPGAAVATGSHVDTQPAGGRLDGAYGVCAGLEVIAALEEAGCTTHRPIEVVVWSNEEGCRFAPGSLGSKAFAEPALLPTLTAARDAEGVTYASCVTRLADALADVAAAPVGGTFHAFVEAHIEQGPVLEDRGVPVGIVTAVQGVRWFRVSAKGAPAHAGTTPLAYRRDALRALTPLLERLYAAAEVRPDLRLTIGRIDVWPSSVNTIPGEANVTVDVRHGDAEALDRIEALIRGYCQEPRFGCSLTCDSLMSLRTTAFDAQVAATLRQSARALQLASSDLVSGAFHDAVHVASVCPTAMLFVPSHQGVSHNPAEHTDPALLLAGTRVLAHALTRLAGAILH